MAEQMAPIERDTAVPDVTDYDVLLVNSSGGKDSQAMLDYVVELADAAGVRDRIIVLHNDLGRAEWPGTADLAREQAEHYGLRFEIRSRESGLLMEEIEHRGMWPDALNRFCTSDQKRGPSRKFISELVIERRLNRALRVLYCLGLRAEESPGRAKKPILEITADASSRTREVTTWLPILHWTTAQVWERIKASGVRHHWAYDQGMGRLSCSFCVLASPADLKCAARLRPDLADEYVALEHRMGDRFRSNTTMLQLVAEVRGEELDPRDVEHLTVRSQQQRAVRRLARLSRLEAAGKPVDLTQMASQQRLWDEAVERREALEAELPRLADALKAVA